MKRETRRADELVAGTYIKHNGYTERVVFAQTVDGRTLLAFADNTHAQIAASDPVDLATDEEGRDHDADRDRERVANALNALAKTIRTHSLPVPASLRDVRVDFNLDDNADLSGWSEVLRRTPVKHTPSLMPSMSSDELGVDVCITGGTWEFGPELADSVEHRDAVGAFPVVEPSSPLCDEPKWDDELGCSESDDGMHRCRSVGTHHLRPRQHWCKCGAMVISSEPKPAPVGWPLGDGHRPTPPADAMTQDRYDNGEQA